MLTDTQLINGGLSKISSSRINRIDPARTPLEIYMASNYPLWKRAELARRAWVFATEANYQLTKEATLVDVDRPYKYRLPIDCLRPIRTKYAEWVQRGRFLFSNDDALQIDYIRNAHESEFDPLFEEVLMCKISFESCEYVNQSSTKKESAKEGYRDAVLEAGRANAFTKGPENVGDENNDSAFSWLAAHNGSI